MHVEASNPLDPYSQIVSGVAAKLTPRVASLRVPRGGQGAGYGRGESLGSGVVFTGDGFLLTNAHVVGKSTSGTAEFSDGTSAPFRVVGADPLSDASARVVGINTAVAGVGLGMAVPVNATTRKIISALMQDGRVRRAYLGLAMMPGPVPAVWRERLGRKTGLLVAQVVAGGPADRAGLRQGDLLLTVAGKPVAVSQDLQRLMFSEAIGRPLAITVMRNGALVDV